MAVGILDGLTELIGLAILIFSPPQESIGRIPKRVVRHTGDDAAGYPAGDLSVGKRNAAGVGNRSNSNAPRNNLSATTATPQTNGPAHLPAQPTHRLSSCLCNSVRIPRMTSR